MKLEHLIQSYNFNKIPAKIKEEFEAEKERAGTIEFYNGITASYLLDNEDIIIAMKLFMNCLTRDTLTIAGQLSHTIKVLQVMQQTIMLLGNIPQKECNMILEKLGLFDNTFQKRKTNKTLRAYVQNRSNRWIIMFKYGGNIMKEVQVININKDTVLVFKIKGQMSRKVYEKTKKSLEEQIGCTCILQGEGIEIDKVLNKKELSEEKIELEDKDVIEIKSTTNYAEGKPIATTMKYKYKSDINQNIKCERNIYSCGIDGRDKDY